MPVEEKRRKLNLPKLPKFRFSFNHRRRLFLNIALILAFLLILSIFFTMKKYHDDKEKALFQSIYPQAQQYFSEGKGLATVNASLSQDSYKKAQTLLQNGETRNSIKDPKTINKLQSCSLKLKDHCKAILQDNQPMSHPVQPDKTFNPRY